MLILTSIASAAAPVGLCTAEERVRLACVVKGGKLVSLCEAKGALHYRFGKPGALELELPKAEAPAIDVAWQSTGPDGKKHIASAWNEGHRYAVVSDRTEDQFDVSVVVRKGAGKPLATLNCTEQLGIDFTETQGFTADPARAESWIGAWVAGDTTLTVVSEGKGLAISEGMATWQGANPGQIHTGEVAGPLTRVAADHLRYTRDACVLDLKRNPQGELVVEDNLRCGGMNVSFAGHFFRD